MSNHTPVHADPHLVSRLFGRVHAINKRQRAADTFNIHCEISAVAYILETGSTDAEKFEREELQPGISAEARNAISIAAGTLARLAAKGVNPANARAYIERRMTEFEANVREEFRPRR